MVQTNIYEFLQDDVDPLLIQINNLQKGKSFVVMDHEVSLNNFNYYEISSCDSHEMFPSKEKCYQRLCEIVSTLIMS